MPLTFACASVICTTPNFGTLHSAWSLLDTLSTQNEPKIVYSRLRITAGMVWLKWDTLGCLADYNIITGKSDKTHGVALMPCFQLLALQ